MTQKTTARPVNSLVVVEDPKNQDVPPWEDGKLVVASSTALFVVCYPEIDGPTEIVLGPASEVGLKRAAEYDGDLMTPSRKVVVTNVELKTLLSEKVSGTKTRVRVWLNHDRWPDKVVIGLD